uniref:Uncharacterized protein n=1 Tax=Hyaloperonospora arabidopsidis (strain Emoy2) TaxID=559515 RepID=M4B1L6_HYAAE
MVVQEANRSIAEYGEGRVHLCVASWSWSTGHEGMAYELKLRVREPMPIWIYN